MRPAFVLALLWFANLGLFVGLEGCHLSVKETAVIAAVATVKTVDEGIKVFTDWAIKQEDAIANQAIEMCSKTTLPFGECVHAEAAKLREPIEKVKAAMKVYDAALAAGQAASGSGSISQASAALIEALAACGISVGG